MSVKAILWAFERRCGSSSAKLVLIKLADNANDFGVCWPSLSYIEFHTELSRATVKTAIKHLADLKYLEIECRYKDGIQLPNIYHLDVDNQKLKTAVDKGVDNHVDNPVDSAEVVGQQLTGGGPAIDGGRADSRPETGRQLTTEPSLNPHRTLNKPKTAGANANCGAQTEGQCHFEGVRFTEIAKRLCGPEGLKLDRMLRQIFGWAKCLRNDPIERVNAVVEETLTAFEAQYGANGWTLAAQWNLLESILWATRREILRAEHEANKNAPVPEELKPLLEGIG